MSHSYKLFCIHERVVQTLKEDYLKNISLKKVVLIGTSVHLHVCRCFEQSETYLFPMCANVLLKGELKDITSLYCLYLLPQYIKTADNEAPLILYTHKEVRIFSK